MELPAIESAGGGSNGGGSPGTNGSGAAIAAAAAASVKSDECDRIVVGCIALEQVAQHKGELRRMSVEALWQRRGVAARMASTLIAHAKQKGLTAVELTTTAAQPRARKLYSKLGWVEVDSGYMLSGVPVPWHKYLLTLERDS